MNTAAKPNSSKNNQTGSWRQQRPVVLPEKCLACQLCAKLCPDACIAVRKKPKNGKNIAVIDYRYCKGCGLCAQECPVKAIIIEKEEKSF